MEREAGHDVFDVHLGLTYTQLTCSGVCACGRFAYWNKRLGGSGSCSRSRSLERIASTLKSD